ncbi:MAG TPA: pyrimidine/purine nucleoside phosphorylase [Bacteroidota bacterium]|nr:pyrimidine/purine nucleoside phosphorylase [Bacteroidota bacterium]
MKHNSYFDGQVQSLSLTTADGSATVGVISKGAFTFGTSSQERMVITSGTLKAKLPGTEWKSFSKNTEFIVPPNSSFDVEADSDVSYICYYK